MYVKPEVIKYSGSELLDLMGPVETAYCDLSGQQSSNCDVEFILRTPGDQMLENIFDDELGVGFILRGPDNCVTRSGVCGDNADDCILYYNDPDGDSRYISFLVDACGLGTCSQGNWTLEAWWILDGDELPSCTASAYFE